ncbi:hypothetical protein MBLNU459_g5041t1 [Dothideomycetes sp. NU459]
MAMSEIIPIVIGVADIKNKSLETEDAVEPMMLMLAAIKEAAKDAGLSDPEIEKLLAATDSLSIVKTWTWSYDDLPGLLASKIKADPKYRLYTADGGNQPCKLFDEAARRISQGQAKVAILAGGEALASLGAYIAVKQTAPPTWTKPTVEVKGAFKLGTNLLAPGLSRDHAVGLPTQVYAMYENARRAQKQQSLRDNHNESASLYASFAQIAASNPVAWNYGKPAQTEHAISSISPKNRMINFPYPLLMNAFNNVNLAGACILTSTQYAREIKVPESKWVYPIGGAGTSESSEFWKRKGFSSSQCIGETLDACLKASDLAANDIDAFDFYSCFPIVPKMACDHLGLSVTRPEKPISLLGGLTSFGGAGNNYSMHALAELVRQIRKGQVKHGLVLANGGTATYQHAVCLSSSQRRDGSAYPAENRLPVVLSDASTPAIENRAEGAAIIEASTWLAVSLVLIG